MAAPDDEKSGEYAVWSPMTLQLIKQGLDAWRDNYSSRRTYLQDWSIIQVVKMRDISTTLHSVGSSHVMK